MPPQPHAHIAQSLERAWQHKDLVALSSILSDTLEWYEAPFDAPLTTKQQVLEHWQHDLSTQSSLEVKITLLDFVGNRSYHRIIASWQDSRTGAHKTDALIRVELGPDGRLTAFTMWSANG